MCGVCAMCIEEIFKNKDEVCIVKCRNSYLLIVNSTRIKKE